jgi:hypothetical protein
MNAPANNTNKIKSAEDKNASSEAEFVTNATEHYPGILVCYLHPQLVYHCFWIISDLFSVDFVTWPPIKANPLSMRPSPAMAFILIYRKSSRISTHWNLVRIVQRSLP